MNNTEIVYVDGETLYDAFYRKGDTAQYHGEVYSFVERNRTNGDGEWYQIIVQRQSDKKYFAFEWGNGYPDNFYEDNLYEVTPKQSIKYE